MSTPYMGQLLLASFNFPPKGYLFCNGQLQSISQYTALFALLGTSFGGNGISTFALPNLQGTTPVGVGNGIGYGEVGGKENHTLISTEVPAHTHVIQAASTANLTKLNGALLAGNGASLYAAASGLAAMKEGTLASTGGNQPHENRQPFLVMTWCIAMTGIFPTRS
jgi:microcystin-dependent protein